MQDDQTTTDLVPPTIEEGLQEKPEVRPSVIEAAEDAAAENAEELQTKLDSIVHPEKPPRG